MRFARARVAVAVVVVAGSSCKGTTERVGVPNVPPASSFDGAPAPLPEASVLDARASSADENGARGSAVLMLSPIDVACATTADCAVVPFHVDGPYVCCPSCQVTAVARSWAARAIAICSRASSRTCYPLACPQPSQRARCEAGTCVLE
ncbi:MAG: hypothetical protein AB7P03_17460 [Kofleriaceae bacterium]